MHKVSKPLLDPDLADLDLPVDTHTANAPVVIPLLFEPFVLFALFELTTRLIGLLDLTLMLPRR